jgi:hypothetical protein
MAAIDAPDESPVMASIGYGHHDLTAQPGRSGELSASSPRSSTWSDPGPAETSGQDSRRGPGVKVSGILR